LAGTRGSQLDNPQNKDGNKIMGWKKKYDIRILKSINRRYILDDDPVPSIHGQTGPCDLQWIWTYGEPEGNLRS